MERATIDLTPDEQDMLVNCLNTMCNGGHAIPEWEFTTLIGFERAEVQILLDRLASLRPDPFRPR